VDISFPEARARFQSPEGMFMPIDGDDESAETAKADFCGDYHLLAHLESSLRRWDRAAASDSSISLSDGRGEREGRGDGQLGDGDVRAEGRVHSLGARPGGEHQAQLPLPCVLAAYVTGTNFCELTRPHTRPTPFTLLPCPLPGASSPSFGP